MSDPKTPKTTLINAYYDPAFIAESIGAGQHRGVIGGLWDEVGRLQFDYVRAHGLARGMRFVDIGCGCLRGGLHFVDYLEAGHYYGIDLSQDLLDVGYDTELAEAGLQPKLPRENLHCTDGFDAGHFGVAFDMALALSVFTHLTVDHLRLCLTRLAEAMPPRGRFFATVFLPSDDHDGTQAQLHTPGGITTYPDRDPFHHRPEDSKSCCRGLPWTLERLESWNHPRDQWMATYVRTADPA